MIEIIYPEKCGTLLTKFNRKSIMYYGDNMKKKNVLNLIKLYYVVIFSSRNQK